MFLLYPQEPNFHLTIINSRIPANKVPRSNPVVWCAQVRLRITQIICALYTSMLVQTNGTAKDVQNAL